MSHDHVLDTYAWVEYFIGSKKGRRVEDCLEDSVTPSIVLAELANKYSREGRQFLERDLAFIESKSVIQELTRDIAVEAGKIHAKKRETVKDWGFVDSIILATARSLNAKVVTGDKHFKSEKNVVFLG